MSYHCPRDDAPLTSSNLDRHHEEWIAVKNCKHRTGGYLLLLGLTIAVFVGCGGGTGTATKSVNTGSAQLAVSPSSMNFGSVLVGESKALPGTLTATNASVTVSSAAWSGRRVFRQRNHLPYRVAGRTGHFIYSYLCSAGYREFSRKHQFCQ